MFVLVGNIDWRSVMTEKVRCFLVVSVEGHIDEDFSRWEASVLARVAREMELQFGASASVRMMAKGDRDVSSSSV